jgi:hypothetical protein
VNGSHQRALGQQGYIDEPLLVKNEGILTSCINKNIKIKGRQII